MTILGLIFIGLGALAVTLVCTKYRPKKGPLAIGLFLFAWHTAVAFGHHWLFQNEPVDAFTYFADAYYARPFGLGTDFVTFIVSQIRGFFPSATSLDVFLLFNIPGAIGLLLFYLTCLDLFGQTRQMRIPILACLLLPGMSFWSVAIGKDVIVFLGIQLCFFALLNVSKRTWLMALGLLLIFTVRPHIAVLLGASIGLSFVFASHRYRLVGSLLAAAIGVLLWFTIPFVLQFLQIGSLNALAVQEFIDTRSEALSTGGSNLDIRSLNIFERIFAYVYRPTLLEADSLSALVAAAENALFAVATLWLLFMLRRIPVRLWTSNPNSALLMFLVSGIISSASLTGNLGMAARQKYQFLPALFLLLLSARFYLLQRQQHLRAARARARSESGHAHPMAPQATPLQSRSISGLP